MIGRSMNSTPWRRSSSSSATPFASGKSRLAPTSLRHPVRISRVPAIPPTYAFFSRHRTRSPRAASNAVAARPLCPAPMTQTSDSDVVLTGPPATATSGRERSHLWLLCRQIEPHREAEAREQAHREVDPGAPEPAPGTVDHRPQWKEEGVRDDEVLAAGRGSGVGEQHLREVYPARFLGIGNYVSHVEEPTRAH